MGIASLKIAGGTLVKAEVTVARGSIASVRLTGDFFLYPEETLSLIESSLEKQKLEEMELAATVAFVILSNGAQLIGATPRDFARVIMEAAK